MIVLFFGVKIANYGQESIANHCEPDVSDCSTACVYCDSNTISVTYKNISNDKVNFSEPLSQLQHACERSFAKFKIVKNYLRSTISQDLALLCVENERGRMIRPTADVFAEQKARKTAMPGHFLITAVE